jgi:hypothetical protein
VRAQSTRVAARAPDLDALLDRAARLNARVRSVLDDLRAER